MKASWSEKVLVNTADYTALSSFTSEASLLAGSNQQVAFPPLFWDGLNAIGKTVRFEASGVLGSTGTPTYTFQARLGTTAGSSSLTGASIGVSPAITTGSGVTNKMWRLVLDLVCRTPGQGTGNTTFSCDGFVQSDGFASPFWYPLEVTTPDTATWTQTRDSTLMMFFNLSVTCSASDASNTIRCKKLLAMLLD